MDFTIGAPPNDSAIVAAKLVESIQMTLSTAEAASRRIEEFRSPNMSEDLMIHRALFESEVDQLIELEYYLDFRRMEWVLRNGTIDTQIRFIDRYYGFDRLRLIEEGESVRLSIADKVMRPFAEPFVWDIKDLEQGYSIDHESMKLIRAQRGDVCYRAGLTDF